MPNLKKIRPVGAELFSAGGRAGMHVTKVTVALLSFANPSNKTLKCIVWAGRVIFVLLNPLSHEVTTRLCVYRVMLMLTIYGEYEITWRLINS
jgi:hypothetical protein